MKMLVCSDGHAHAENAVRFVAPIAAGCGAEVTVLGIIEHPADETSLHESLRRQTQILRDRKVSVELITKSGQPIEEIQKRTGESQYDLVVIGATRKGTSGSFWMAAKVYKIIKLIKPPVLLVIGERTGLKRILICSGGRSYIDRAVELTGEIVCAGDVSVTILHVMAEPPAMYADLLTREEDTARLLASSSVLGRNLRSEKEALEAMGIKTEVRLRHGIVLSEVFDEVQSGNYDLVVTGSAPASGTLQTYIMGDVTAEIVNRADTPVLVVRGGEGPSRGGLFSKIARLFSQQ